DAVLRLAAKREQCKIVPSRRRCATAGMPLTVPDDTIAVRVVALLKRGNAHGNSRPKRGTGSFFALGADVRPSRGNPEGPGTVATAVAQGACAARLSCNVASSRRAKQALR